MEHGNEQWFVHQTQTTFTFLFSSSLENIFLKMVIVLDWWLVLGRCITIELMIYMFLVFMEHQNKQIFDLVLKFYCNF